MAAQAQFEKRSLLVSTAFTILGFVFQIVAICTDNWLILYVPGGAYRNATGRYLVEAHSGLWRICRIELTSKTGSDRVPTENKHRSCESHNLFPTEEEIRLNNALDNHFLDYTRTAIAFTIIALLLILLGHGFAIYTLKRPRYIIKRLTALLHLMTAACILVLNEVFSKSVEHDTHNLAERYPVGAESSFGFSFVLSWLVFVIYMIAGLIFLFMSHKRKAEMADVEDTLAQEDEPMQLGRV